MLATHHTHPPLPCLPAFPPTLPPPQALQPYSPDASQLALAGTSIEAALSASLAAHGGGAGAGVTLADVMARLAVADPALLQELRVGGWRREVPRALSCHPCALV
jgi:hypothetical protein